jgi:hypothetical protein
VAPAYANLSTILAELRSTAPDVRIVGMNYYDGFLWLWIVGRQELTRQYNGFVLLFNDGLEASYAAANVPVADVESAFATTDFTTMVNVDPYGEIPINVANICQWTRACSPPGENLHPYTVGYAVIAQSFANVLGF